MDSQMLSSNVPRPPAKDKREHFTVTIPASLIARFKTLCALEDKTISKAAERALAEYIEKRDPDLSKLKDLSSD